MRWPAGKGSAVFFIIFHDSTPAMCNSELYLTVVTGGGGGLAEQSGAAVGQHGGGSRCLRCLCVSRVGTHPLPRNTRARVDIYIYICVCVCVLHLTNITSMYSMEEEDAADTRLIHRREYCSPFSPLSSACTRIGRSSRPISYAGISISFYSSRIRKEKLFQNYFECIFVFDL